MMKFITITGIASLSLALSGCFGPPPPPPEIQASRVSVAPYLKMNCKELATEQSQLRNQIAYLRGVESKSTEEKAQLSSAKGQLRASEEACKANSCSCDY